MVKQVKRRMCVINPALMADIAPIVGGQADIMCKVGISWNSWTKIANGMPIRYSMGERFKARIVDSAESIEGLRARFPSACGGINYAALEDAFFLSDESGENAGDDLNAANDDLASAGHGRDQRWTGEIGREAVAQH